MKSPALFPPVPHLAPPSEKTERCNFVWGAHAPGVLIAAPGRNVLEKRKSATARAPSRAHEARALPRLGHALRTVLLIAFCLVAAVPKAKAAAGDGPSRTGDEFFTKANNEFAAGDFKAAIKEYDAVVQSGEWSANLFYDLGNSYFRDSDFGRAILNYERALQLDRNHPEADANLRIARDQTHPPQLTPSPLEKHLSFATPKLLTIVAAVLFWGTVLLALLRRRKALWLVVGLLLTASCAFAVYRLENGVRGSAVAVVVADNAEARIATADSAKSVLALPPGSEVLILQERGDWSYASLPNDQRGWIASKAVEKVRL